MATKYRKKKSASKSKSKFRASWRGQLRFGLVSFEVQAVNAQNKNNAAIHFHLLHEPDHERIHYAKVCPKHGEVPNDEIVEGFEYAKGKYVEFERDEIDNLRTQKERALSIDAFISVDTIDPIYFDGRMYYLIPSATGSSEPYALLATAMENKERWGVGQVVFSGREQLVIIRPVDGVLTMAMLNYDAELRKPSEIKRDFSKVQVNSRQLKLAEELIGKWHEGKFDLKSYKDRYQEKVKRAIDAKKKGVDVPPPEEDEPDVINLMDALQRSVAGLSGRSKRRNSNEGKSKTMKRTSSIHRRRRA